MFSLIFTIDTSASGVDKFLCALKVVDSSLKDRGKKAKSKEEPIKYASIVVVGERIEDMPIIRNIGDIIRIQKASLKVKNGQKQFVVDERSNWALWGPLTLGPDGVAKTTQIQADEMEVDQPDEKDDPNFK